jgi:hypothetical protein
MLFATDRFARRRQTPRWVWIWLWLALLLAPSVGQMHRVLHLPGGSVPTQHAEGLAALFAGHSPADCEQLDQLTQGCAPSWQPPPLPGPWPDAVRTLPLAAAPQSAPLRAFHARAPPWVAPTKLLF